jgi:5-methylcytosine-specific restriction endonuclease McrA
LDILAIIGCNTKIKVETREPDRNGFVEITNQHSNHTRGLDSFDPEASIFELENVLLKPNLNKAKIIWSILRDKYKVLRGTIERSTKKDFQPSKKEDKISVLGEILMESEWIPTLDGNYKKPEMVKMSDIKEEIFKDVQETPLIASKLGIVGEDESKILKKFPFIKMLQDFPIDERKKIEKEIVNLIDGRKKQMVSPNQGISFSQSFRNALERKSQPSREVEEDQIWNSITPEKEKDIITNDDTIERVSDSNVTTTPIISKKYKNDSFDPKTFLKNEYHGHCQICNIILDLGADKDPYFEIYRIIERKDNPSWSEIESNVISLCPNCHALAKYGTIDLSSIIDSLNDITTGNKISEPVSERNGDFYIFDTILAGRPTKIYYTQRHIDKVISTFNSCD